MIEKLRNELKILTKDFWSCWDHLLYLIEYPPSDRLVIICVGVVFMAILFLVPSEGNGLLLNTVLVFLALYASFVCYFISNSFWFFYHKSNFFHSFVINRVFLKKELGYIEERKLNMDQIEDPESILCNIVYFYSTGIKQLKVQNMFEIILVVVLLMWIAPALFFVSLTIFCSQYFYTLFVEKDFFEDFYRDLIIVLIVVQQLYRDDPKKCNSLILENDLVEFKTLSSMVDVIRESS